MPRANPVAAFRGQDDHLRRTTKLCRDRDLDRRAAYADGGIHADQPPRTRGGPPPPGPAFSLAQKRRQRPTTYRSRRITATILHSFETFDAGDNFTIGFRKVLHDAERPRLAVGADVTVRADRAERRGPDGDPGGCRRGHRATAPTSRSAVPATAPTAWPRSLETAILASASSAGLTATSLVDTRHRDQPGRCHQLDRGGSRPAPARASPSAASR